MTLLNSHGKTFDIAGSKSLHSQVAVLHFKILVVINDSTLANAAKKDIRSLLLDRINPDFDLLDILLRNEALDRKEYQEIKSRPTSYDKNVLLLEIVTRKEKLREFFEALAGSRQEHLVNYVTANGGQ